MHAGYQNEPKALFPHSGILRASTILWFKLKRKLRLSDLLLCKIPLARKMRLCGNEALNGSLLQGFNETVNVQFF